MAKKPLSAVGVRGVQLVPGGAVSRGRHGVGDGDGGILRQVGDVDVRALVGQPERDRATHARAAPDDRGDSALEPAGHASSRVRFEGTRSVMGEKNPTRNGSGCSVSDTDTTGARPAAVASARSARCQVNWAYAASSSSSGIS